MSDGFDLDLRHAEDEMDDEDAGEFGDRVVLGVLDGSTPPEEWTAAIERGQLLVLDVEGDLNELASPFARDVKDMGGSLMHFRGFLLVTPPGVDLDPSRLDGDED